MKQIFNRYIRTFLFLGVVVLLCEGLFAQGTINFSGTSYTAESFIGVAGGVFSTSGGRSYKFVYNRAAATGNINDNSTNFKVSADAGGLALGITSGTSTNADKLTITDNDGISAFKLTSFKFNEYSANTPTTFTIKAFRGGSQIGSSVIFKNGSFNFQTVTPGSDFFNVTSVEITTNDATGMYCFFDDVVIETIPTLPSISYPAGAKSYIIGLPITPLTLTNSGSALPAAAPGAVTGFVGTGAAGSADNAIGGLATFNLPHGIVVDGLGNTYIADFGNNKIRKISASGAVTTYAGTGAAGGTNNAVATSATFNTPTGVAVDAIGNVYVADFFGNRIRKISPAGVVTTVAGNGATGSSDNAIGTLATFSKPTSIVLDATGNIYVTDNGNHKIRKISTTGAVTTFAGSGASGSLDNVIGTSATFTNPYGITIDAAGNLYVVDQGNNKIRKVSTSGAVTTIAGSGANATSDNNTGTLASFNNPFGITIDGFGNLYVSEFTGRKVRKISTSGAVSTLAGSGINGSANNIDGILATFGSISGLAVDVTGTTLYVADYGGNKIRKISLIGYSISKKLPTGLIFNTTTGTISGTPTAVSDASNYTITAINASGGNSTTINIATTNTPVIIASDNLSMFFTCAGIAATAQSFAISGTNLTADISITAPAGFEIARTASGVYSSSLTLTQSGGAVALTNVFVRLAATATGSPSSSITCSSAGANSQIIFVLGTAYPLPTISLGTVTAISNNASSFELPYSATSGSPNQYSITSGSPVAMSNFSPISNNSLVSSPISVSVPTSAATTYNFNITVKNSSTGCISPNNPFTVIVLPAVPNISYASNTQVYNLGSAITPFALSNNGGIVPQGAMGVTTLAGTGKPGYADNNNALLAMFDTPYRVTLDSSGNIYVSDVYNHRIRKISATGVVTTFAGNGAIGFENNTNSSLASFNFPQGLAFDANGNLFIADAINNSIRKINTSGTVTTFAGGLYSSVDNVNGALAGFKYPADLAFDVTGNLYVADLYNYKIRKISPAGSVTTLAGNGQNRSVDNLNGALASFNEPQSIAVDGTGNVYVGETYNNQIRKISPAGSVTTFVGRAIGLDSMIGAQAAAKFSPRSLVFDASGNLYAADGRNAKIWKISKTGLVTIVAGSTTGFADTSIATLAKFKVNNSIAFDALGNLIVADPFNDRIRKITQYGYLISPSLPAGLNFDYTNGTIYGTPTEVKAPTVYTITASNASGTSTTTVTLSVIVPTLNITGSLSSFKTCAGTASAPQSFSVSGLNLTRDINITAPANFELATTAAGIYSSSLTLTQSGGSVALTSVYIRVAASATTATTGGVISCTSVGAASKNVSISNSSVTVNAIPATPIINASGPTTICSGKNVVLNSGLDKVNWYADNIFYAKSNALNFWGNLTITTNLTDANGCTSLTSTPIVITTLKNPVASIVQGTQLAFANCNASNINLNANAGSGFSYQWMNDNGNISGAVSQQFVVPQTGNYRVQVTDANNCSSVSAVTKVSAIPSATVSGSTSVCAGNTVSLSASGTFTNPTYQWLKDGVVIANATASTYAAASTGNYSVTVISGGLSSTSCAISVTIFPLPVITVSASPGTSVCAGTPLSLNATVNGNNTYQWLIGGNAIDSAKLSSFNISQNGSYSVRVTDANGCINTSSETVVSINTLPTPTAITGTTAIKVNDSASLLSLPAGGIWSSSNTAVAKVNANGGVTGLVPGKATITYTLVNASNCSASVSALVTVKAATIKPVITAGSATSFCSGGSVVLSSNAVSGNQWYKDGVILGGATSSSYTASSNGSYTVTTGIDAVSSDPIEVEVFTNPDATILQGAQLAFSNCATTSITLSAINNIPEYTYQWRNNSGDILNATGFEYTVTQADNYSLRVTDLNNCITTSAATRVTATPSATAGGSTVVCEGASVPLNVNAAAYTNPTYQWQVGGTNIIGAINVSYRPTATGNYTVVVTDGAVTSTSCPISVTVNPLPVVSISTDKTVCAGSSAELTATSAAVSYQWLNNDNIISTATSNTYNTSVAGQYSVQVKDANGCSNNSATSTVSVIPLKVLEPISGADTICVNSTANFVNDFAGGVWSSSNTAIALVDVTGVVTGVGPGTAVISYTATNASCSSTTVTKNIFVNPLTIITSAPIALLSQCVGSSGNIRVTATGINLSYQWYQNGSAIAGANSATYSNPNLTAAATGNYSVIVSGGCGSISSDASLWTINPLPIVGSITGPLQICTGASNQLANSFAGGVWTTSNASIATVNSSTGLVKGVSIGSATITYTVTSASGCISSVSASVTVISTPTVTASSSVPRISKGLNVPLYATTTGTIATYNWTPPTNLSSAAIANPIARVTDNTNYVVTVTSTQGCVAKDSVSVTVVEDLYVAPTNVFTPNGDGINDRFVIRNLDQYPINNLKVFDRTGRLLYEKANYANDWDGSINGKILVKDTYFYILTVKGQEVKKGTITLVR